MSFRQNFINQAGGKRKGKLENKFRCYKLLFQNYNIRYLFEYLLEIRVTKHTFGFHTLYLQLRVNEITKFSILMMFYFTDV